MASMMTRSAAEAELVQSELRYRLLAENVTDVVVITHNGVLAWVSPSVRNAFGWRPDQLVGVLASSLVHPDDLGLMLSMRAQIYEGGRPQDRIRIRSHDGSMNWVEVTTRPSFGVDGEVDGAVFTLRDISDEVANQRALTTLSAGNAILIRSMDEQVLLGEMCATAVDEGGYVFSWYGRAIDDDKRSVAAVASSVVHRDYLDGLAISWGDGPMGNGPTGTAIRTGVSFVLNDILSDVRYTPWIERATAAGFRSSVSLPVVVDGRVDGAFMVYASEVDAFDDRAVSLLEDLAGHLGYGLNRLRERDRLDRTLGSAVDLLAAAVESRDPYTAGHQAQVAAIAVAIGTEMGLDERQLEALSYGARLHDIGKIAVPSALLTRPGQLRPEEMALVRCHATVGWEIASRYEWPHPVAEIIHQHHERLDGSGYPEGLHGGEIVLEARIVAVADVFDAMAADRPYRAALGPDRARAIVVEGAGILFDAEVVAAFERVLDAGFTIHPGVGYEDD